MVQIKGINFHHNAKIGPPGPSLFIVHWCKHFVRLKPAMVHRKKPFGIQPWAIFVVQRMNLKNNNNEKNDSKIGNVNSNGNLIF